MSVNLLEEPIGIAGRPGPPGRRPRLGAAFAWWLLFAGLLLPAPLLGQVSAPLNNLRPFRPAATGSASSFVPQHSSPAPAHNLPGGPHITSVSPIYPLRMQKIVIRGTGFGTANPYNGWSGFLMFVDLSHGNGITSYWQAGCPVYVCGTGGLSVYVSKWTPTEIDVEGFPQYYATGTFGMCHCVLKAGDQEQVLVGNPQMLGAIKPPPPAPYGFPAAAHGTPYDTYTVTVAPWQNPVSITSVSTLQAARTQKIIIRGTGFGNHDPYNGTTPFLGMKDVTANNWEAGFPGTVGLIVTSWTPNEIVIDGFTQGYGGPRVLHRDDIVGISVADPQMKGVVNNPGTAFRGAPHASKFVTVGQASASTGSAPGTSPGGGAGTTAGGSAVPASVTLKVSPATVAAGGMFSASGTVTGTNGAGLAGATVQLSVSAGRSNLPLATTSSLGGGVFAAVLKAPPNPGSFTVQAAVQGASPPVSATATLAVENSTPSKLQVVSVAATAPARTYLIVFPPQSTVCSSGTGASDQTTSTPAYCPPKYNYAQLQGSAVPVAGGLVKIQVTYSNPTSTMQQAPRCIPVIPGGGGGAQWWSYPFATQAVGPPADATFTAASPCPDLTSGDEASLQGSGGVGPHNTLTLTYVGRPTWTAFNLKSEPDWNSLQEAITTSLGAADKVNEVFNVLPQSLATASNLLGVASVVAEAASFANGVIKLGALNSVPWLTYQTQIQGNGPYPFKVYAQPEKLAVFDALLWDLKWRMVPMVGGETPGLAAGVLDGLQKLSLGTDDCVYQIVSSGGTDGPSYAWFYNELKLQGSDQVLASAAFKLGTYVNAGACTWTGLE